MDDVSPALYQRIAALEAQVAYLFQHLQMAPPPVAQLVQSAISDEILQLVRAGKTIDAIKRHRELYGSSLIEAKTAVDGLS